MSTPEPAYVARLGLNSKTPLNLVKNMPGYTTPVFKGKEEQRALVEEEVASKVCVTLTQWRINRSLIFPSPGLYSARTRRWRGQLVLLQPRHR